MNRELARDDKEFEIFQEIDMYVSSRLPKQWGLAAVHCSLAMMDCDSACCICVGRKKRKRSSGTRSL